MSARHLPLALLIANPTLAAVQDAPPATLMLEDAVELALVRSHDLQADILERFAAGALRRAPCPVPAL